VSKDSYGVLGINIAETANGQWSYDIPKELQMENDDKKYPVVSSSSPTPAGNYVFDKPMDALLSYDE
jgi:hypothetical protein